MKRGVKMREKCAYLWFMLVLTILWSVLFVLPCAAADAETVLLPSRFGGEGAPLPMDDASKMVEEWLRATGAAPGADGSSSSRPYMINRARRDFRFGVTRPEILCRTGMITDIELEPGERVENFSISDGREWSISAAWNGDLGNLVTHILLRPFFPGLKTNLAIYTDRRTYSMDLSSSLDGLHMAYIGFKYPETVKHEEEPIPPGRYRDLLARYGIIDDGGSEKTAESKRVDAADLNFSYSIKPLGGGHKKITWTPKSVYDSDGRTFFVMPGDAKKAMGQPSLFVIRNGERIPTPLKASKNGLLMTETVFDEASLKLGGDEVSIIRLRQEN